MPNPRAKCPACGQEWQVIAVPDPGAPDEWRPQVIRCATGDSDGLGCGREIEARSCPERHTLHVFAPEK